MPVIKSAIKKLRQDRKRAKAHDMFRKAVKDAIKQAKIDQKADSISHAFSLIDKAAKKHIVHKNRAARLKSSLSKIIAGVKPASKKHTSVKVTAVSQKPSKKAQKPQPTQ